MIEIDKDLCIGCGACTATFPEVFALGDDGLAEVVKEEINDDVEMAKDSCPTEAIKITAK